MTTTYTFQYPASRRPAVAIDPYNAGWLEAGNRLGSALIAIGRTLGRVREAMRQAREADILYRSLSRLNDDGLAARGLRRGDISRAVAASFKVPAKAPAASVTAAPPLAVTTPGEELPLAA